MTKIWRNAYINVVDMKGNTKYTNKRVQMDDVKPTTQVFIDRIPLVNKQMYDTIDQVPVAYARGDIVTILSIDGYTVDEADNVFWIERANSVGPPLPAWDVGLVGGRVCNATINTFRLMVQTNELVPVEEAIRVTYIPPTTDVVQGYGDRIDSYILMDPQYNIIEHDKITVVEIDGFNTVDTVSEYVLDQVSKFPTPVPHIHVKFTGALQ